MLAHAGSDGLLCGIVRRYAGSSFILSWVTVTLWAAIFIISFSGYAFYKLYWPSQVTYEKWVWKTNAKFPTPEKVRDEIIQTTKGMWCAALCPALAFWLYAQGDLAPVNHYGYCGTTPDYGVGYNIFLFFFVWIASDFWEWGYHYIGHRFSCMWNWHRHHHVFFNPTPFSVIADEFVDQFFRALPLVLFPLVMPMNLDIMYGVFTVLFYGTGVYHHCGYELRWPNAHTGFFNTSYHHYLHHSISINQKPYHCGFMFQVWDRMVGSVYHGKCFCVHCAQAKGLRSREEFEKLILPDYTQLLKPSFWISADLISVLTGTSASDANEELLSKEGQVVTAEVSADASVVKRQAAIARGAVAVATAATTAS